MADTFQWGACTVCGKARTVLAPNTTHCFARARCERDAAQLRAHASVGADTGEEHGPMRSDFVFRAGNNLTDAGIPTDTPRLPSMSGEDVHAWADAETGMVHGPTRADLPGPPPCPRCGAPTVERSGRYGPFRGCSTFSRTGCTGKADRTPGERRMAGTFARPRTVEEQTTAIQGAQDVALGRAQLQEAQDAVARLSAQLETMTKRARELDAALANKVEATRAERDTWRTERQRLTAERDEAIGERDFAVSERSAVSGLVERLERERDDARNTVRGLRDVVEAVRAGEAGAIRERDEAREERAQLRLKVSDLAGELRDLETEVEGLRKLKATRIDEHTAKGIAAKSLHALGPVLLRELQALGTTPDPEREAARLERASGVGSDGKPLADRPRRIEVE